MSVAWLEELLPQGTLSPRNKVWWLLFFTLFPLAYVGGVLLEIAEESPARIVGAQDRATAIRTAQAFAASKGFDTAGWQQYAIAETRDNLLGYYGDATQPDLALASALAPAREVQVLLRSRDGSREFRVFLSLTGRVTGFDIGKSSGKHIISKTGFFEVRTTSTESDNVSSTVNASDNARVEALARLALASNPALNRLLTLGTAKVGVNSDDPARTDVAWDISPPGRKELTFHVKVSVRDSQVVAERIEAGVDKTHVLATPKFPTVLKVIYGLFLTFGALYAMYRYAKRTLQKEVSHLRTLTVALLFAISYSVIAYSFALDQIATRVSGGVLDKIFLFSCISSAVTFLIMGLLVGIAYGSGEGEVREAFPGKLTSLDALLAGRIFSRNVAASVVFGAASAGWLMLLHYALGYFLKTDSTALRSDVLGYTFARLPWLTLLLGKQYNALLIAVAGLLVPASFLLRTTKLKWRRYAWLLGFALLSVLRDAAGYPTLASAMLAAIVLASALLFPFFAFDLLAAMVSLSVLSYVSGLARLSAVFPPWIGFALWLAALAAATLALVSYLAFRGRRVDEEEVSPRYAKNLAERMSLQAEVSAAREAQLRLLPQSAPQISGLQVAACCLPARGVGGDFYDFFPLDAHRIGIFIAQGGAEGLASALCIALAKGILMHASLQPHSPTQIILELQDSIAELLEGASAASIGFAYGVIDTRRNLLNYARTGTSPHVLIYREGAGLTTASQLERSVTAQSRGKAAPLIHEGAASIGTKDFLMFFTEGVSALRSRRSGRRVYQQLETIVAQLNRPAQSMQTSLVAALEKCQRQAASDLTAVVLRLVESEPMAQEVVA